MRNKRETKESDIKIQLKTGFDQQISKMDLPPGIESMTSVQDIRNSLSEEGDNVKDKKMKLPIGKLFSVGKSESKESTGAASAGGYSVPLFSGTKKETSEEILKGGVSDNKTLKDIANKHNKKEYYHIDNMLETLKKELSKGIKIEMEHTSDREKAKEIAMDHLYEDPKYYTKLKKIESKEATSSSSVGIYDAPGFEDVTMKGNHLKGSGKTHKKTLLPGGKFVSENVKKNIDDMTEDEIFDLRDSEYLKLKDVIKSVKTEGQYKSMVNYWEFFQKKFEGYLPKRFKENVENKIKSKKTELDKYKVEVEESKKSKIQIPGGKFVQVKEKCKKFPYCNQGDINALNIFEDENLKKIITKISKEKQISESLIKKILTSEINKSISKD